MEKQENSLKFFYRHVMEPVTLFSGIFLNICLYIIIYRKKKTNFLQSTKPMRYLMMVILLSDTWFLIDKLNLWIFSFSKKSSLTSVNFMCQFISYLNYFLPIILEFSMITADYIIISLVMKSSKFSKSANVYNDFLNRRSKSEKYPIDQEKFNLLKKLSKQKKSHSLTESEPSLKLEKSMRLNQSKHEKKNKKAQDFFLGQSMAFEENIYSSKTSNSDESISIDSEKYNHYPKPFLKLIENYKFKREDIYYSIFLKEKFFLILNIFAWMYLLSFIFWIKGLTDLNSNNILHSSNLTSNEPLGNICSTLVYYQRLAAILNMFLSCLKIVTIFFNIFTSVLFHFKFRHEYMLSLRSTFRKNYTTTRFKMLDYKKFYFFYSTKRSWPDYNDFKKSKFQTKYYILHYKHFHFVRHYALTAFIYSFLISFSVFTQYRDNFNQLKELYLNKTEFTAIPESGNFSTLWNDPQKHMLDLYFLKIRNESQPVSFIDKLIKIKHNDGLFILSEYTEYLAHSTKFLIYILFSVHFKFYIKCYKNQVK